MDSRLFQLKMVIDKIEESATELSNTLDLSFPEIMSVAKSLNDGNDLTISDKILVAKQILENQS